MTHFDTQSKPTVLHFGVFSNHAGGISSAIRSYLQWEQDVCVIRAVPTTSKRHDPNSIVKFICAIGILFSYALKQKREKITVVVHFSQFGSFVREGAIARIAHFFGLRTVSHVHGSRFVEFAQSHPKVTVWGVGKSDSILFLTTKSKLVYERIAASSSKSKTFLVWNSVDLLEMGHRSKSNVMVFAGEVGYRKGVDLLLQAWGDGSLFPKWTLKICGPVKKEFQRIAEDSKNTPRLDFLNEMSNRAIRDLLSVSKIAVLPSRAEAQPIFILEAMSAGCCVIASDVGEIASMLSEGAGLVVEPNNVEELRQKMLLATSSDSFSDRIADRAKLRADQFFAGSARSDLMAAWLDL